MMQRHEAFKIFADTREEVLPLLKFVAAERFIGRERRNAIMQARDALHSACSQFDEGEDCTDFEDVFLPLFDALSFVTGILNGADWGRAYDSYRAFIHANVRQAVECLENANRCALPY